VLYGGLLGKPPRVMEGDGILGYLMRRPSWRVALHGLYLNGGMFLVKSVPLASTLHVFANPLGVCAPYMVWAVSLACPAAFPLTKGQSAQHREPPFACLHLSTFGIGPLNGRSYLHIWRVKGPCQIKPSRPGGACWARDCAWASSFLCLHALGDACMCQIRHPSRPPLWAARARMVVAGGAGAAE
jgi:hypothetical protein